MNSKTSRKGASAKFLALLSSLAMITIGLVGVAFAAPASASNNPAEVCSGYAAWARIEANGATSYSTVGISVGATGLPGQSGTWTSSPGAAVVYLHAGDGQDTKKDMGSGTSGTWSDPDHGISTLTFCYDKAPTEFTAPGGSETYCVGEEDVTVKWDGATSTESQQDADDQAAENKSDAYKEAGIAEDATPGTCVTEYTALGGSETYCVGETNVTVSWDGATSTDSQDDANDQAAANKTAAYEKAGIAEDATPSTCTPVKTCQELNNCPTPPVTPQAPPTETATVVETVVVEEATAVTAPLPATVPTKKPAKKPAKVVLPASIPAGVVSVPGSAIVPGSIPAGGGSQAPGIPMWALAMVVVGALGAAGAGMKILGARK